MIYVPVYNIHSSNFIEEVGTSFVELSRLKSIFSNVMNFFL